MPGSRHLCAFLLPVAVVALPAAAPAAPRPEPTPAPPVEVTRALAPIRVDGRLDDEAWSLLAPFIDFVQRDPD